MASTLKDQTGQKHPLAMKARLNEYAPYILGLPMVVVMLQWGHDRIPVNFEMVRRKDRPHYPSANRLFRGMLVRFRRPAWAEMVVVVADAGCPWMHRADVERLGPTRNGRAGAMSETSPWS